MGKDKGIEDPPSQLWKIPLTFFLKPSLIVFQEKNLTTFSKLKFSKIWNFQEKVQQAGAELCQAQHSLSYAQVMSYA